MASIIQLSIGQILASITLLTVLMGAVQWAVTKWIYIRLEKSIEHEYNKKIEDYRFSQIQRQKAELIARLFAKWIKFRGNEKEFLEKNDLISFYEELNQMSIEFSIWIEDAKLLTDVMNLLQLKEDSRSVRELVGEVRKYIHKNPKDNFDPEEIILWPNSEVEKELFRK